MATPEVTQDETLKQAKEYFEGFPEAPYSDSFKWTDSNGFEHLSTVRAWTGGTLLSGIEKATLAIVNKGGKPVNNRPAPLPAPSNEPVMVQMKDENNTPIIDQDHNPVMERLSGAKVYTVEGVAHDTTSNNKDVLKVFTVEKEEFISRKYGVNCFHAPAQYKDFKDWPIGAKFSPREGAMHVVIKAPEGNSKYANIVEFRG